MQKSEMKQQKYRKNWISSSGHHRCIKLPSEELLSIGEMRRNGIHHHTPPDDPDSLISLLLFYYVVWFDFMPINVTFVCQFLPMYSEND